MQTLGSKANPPRHTLRLIYPSNSPIREAAPLYPLDVALLDPRVVALTWEVKGHGPVAPLRQQLQCAQLLPRVGVKGLSMEQHHLHPVGTQGSVCPGDLGVAHRSFFKASPTALPPEHPELSWGPTQGLPSDLSFHCTLGSAPTCVPGGVGAPRGKRWGSCQG